MAEEDLTQISAGEFETVGHLLASSESLQIAFFIMIAGMIGIVLGYRKFSSWVGSQKFYYQKPHFARFLRRAVLPVFAIIFITIINIHIQTGFLLGEDLAIIEDNELAPEEIFAKILNTFNILVIGYTISHLIPISLIKRDKTILEKEDFDAWFEMRGFIDDGEDLFHKFYKWVPPNITPEEIEEKEFKEKLKTKEGMLELEQFRTTRGNPIGGYEKLIDNPFEEWKKSERAKYEKYYKNCITGNNQSGRKLKPGAKPDEIFPIDVWREEKRVNHYEPIIPSSRPPGYAKKKNENIPKSAKQILPVGIFVATVLGVIAWWGVDLIVLATATGGLAIGMGLALQETMQNYFAYILIRKDKIFVEGERVKLDSGYNGYVHKITPRVTYVKDALNESIAIIPTRQLVNAQIINYTQGNKMVPAIVDVGVSYLNDPKQVSAILVKVGKRAMNEVVDIKGKHLIRQIRCPYLKNNQPSCGCDKDIHVDINQPVVRFNQFNDSSLDFSVWVYVRDYGAQFKTKTDMRMIMYEEFKKYDIRIPWPIRTVYQGDEKREQEEINSLNDQRNEVIDKYGLGDLGRGGGGEE
ncbi:mechanosensitive ion channel protein MscS [Nitrosopumilus cobalaminigenes]|uniref:Mechanosensitive ion channel protein MscS n=1 Tax=Nitrosopumilus cobalaminigenes TaxID=1470066 RepID=A0A7D5R251_9ARCH|nr:mechanosensitive ion channel domain-containing protein [Nitrosopumilus cobalaminigenes]QLH03697.1 mechanosensitive ion channel protein MscS [Nitrosopumilus cobalaminigenes]